MTQVRPQPDEYGRAHENYIALVPDGNLLEILESQGRELQTMLGGLSEAQANFRYAPGKWSVKQVLGHITDSERIFAYRALCIGRGDTTAQPGFEQDDYVKGANFDARTLRDLLAEFVAVRVATLATPALVRFWRLGATRHRESE